MAKDTQFDTGDYDPKRYWDARVDHRKEFLLSAIGVYGRSEVENQTMHRVQKAALRRALRSTKLEGQRVLEVGCGIGRWIPQFRRWDSRWCGVDVAPAMLEVAHRQFPNAPLALYDGTRFPLADASFDLVYSVTVVHHNPYEMQERIVEEMARLVRAGGHVLWIEDMGKAGDHNAFNYFPRARREWVALAEAHGLELVWQSGVQYWVLQYAWKGLKRRLRPRKPSNSAKASTRRAGDSTSDSAPGAQKTPPRRSPLQRLIDRLDLWLDPYLVPWLAERQKLAAVLLFTKTGTS